MGTTPDTVLDPQMRVHGVERLRVVDASAMPDLVSAHIDACVLHDGREGIRHDPWRASRSRQHLIRDQVPGAESVRCVRAEAKPDRSPSTIAILDLGTCVLRQSSCQADHDMRTNGDVHRADELAFHDGDVARP